MIDFRRTYNYPRFRGYLKVSRKPVHPAKNDTGDFGKFKNFMQRLVAVPHSEIKAKLDSEKRGRKTRSKRVSVRASSAQS